MIVRRNCIVEGLLCLASLVLAAGMSASAADGAGDGQVRRHALLIGINDYQSSAVSDLNGAVNDVSMMKRILTTRFGFSEGEVRVLTDEQATREGILEAIDTLVSNAAEQDVVYFHYSGHGSRQEDKNGDEDDGFDETILPHDARTPGIRDILDDELERRFGRIRSRNVLIVFDSCYSGTVTRSGSMVQVRAVPPDDRRALYDQVATREVVTVAELPHLLMAGAPPDQEALDAPVDEGFFGLFSYSLARTFDALGPGASAREVHAGVKAELARIQEQLFLHAPEPQLEGPDERLDDPVLPTAATLSPEAPSGDPPRRAWVEVVPAGRDRVRLIDGVALNARPGSQWAVYPPGETRFDFGNAVAFGVVRGLSGRDALLELSLSREPIGPGARAVALAPPDVSESMPVRLVGVGLDRRESLETLIRQRIANVEFVEGDAFARFIVHFNDRGWRLTDAGGLREILSFPDAADPVVAERLAGILSRSSHALSLLALDNPASGITLEVRLSDPTPFRPEGADARGLVKITDNGPTLFEVRAPGEPRTPRNSLMLEILSDRDVYLTIVDVDTEGQVSLLFPNAYQKPTFLPGGFVPADTVVRIPDSLESGNEAGFHWDYSPPAGRDTIRVFATETQELAGVVRDFVSAGGDAEGFSGLRSTLGAAAVRGVSVVPDRPEPTAQTDENTSSAGDWVTRSLLIEVHE